MARTAPTGPLRARPSRNGADTATGSVKTAAPPSSMLSELRQLYYSPSNLQGEVSERPVHARAAERHLQDVGLRGHLDEGRGRAGGDGALVEDDAGVDARQEQVGDRGCYRRAQDAHGPGKCRDGVAT